MKNYTYMVIDEGNVQLVSSYMLENMLIRHDNTSLLTHIKA